MKPEDAGIAVDIIKEIADAQNKRDKIFSFISPHLDDLKRADQVLDSAYRKFDTHLGIEYTEHDRLTSSKIIQYFLRGVKLDE